MREIITIILITVIPIMCSAIGYHYGENETKETPTYQIGETYIKRYNECFESGDSPTIGYCMETTTIVGPLSTNTK